MALADDSVGHPVVAQVKPGIHWIREEENNSHCRFGNLLEVRNNLFNPITPLSGTKIWFGIISPSDLFPALMLKKAAWMDQEHRKKNRLFE
jgi:hypothetical protein